MKKRTRKNILISLMIIGVIVLIISLILLFNSDSNKFSFIEKSWISDNKNNVIDIHIDDDLPVFSLKGSGVFYDYIADFQEETELSFNITYNSGTLVTLYETNNLDNRDIVFYNDHYVIISKENRKYNSTIELSGKIIGVLAKDSEFLKSNISLNADNIREYENVSAIKEAFEKEEINTTILPLIKNLNFVISNNYFINYHLDGINSYYAINVDSTNETLKQIMNKYFNSWQEQFNIKYNENLLNIIYGNLELTEIEKDTITNKNIVVGYIDNLPYESVNKSNFIGVTSEYLKEFAELTGASFKYKKIDDIKDINKTLNDKDIDVLLNYYSINNANYTESTSLGNIDYVVLASNNNDLTIGSFSSLKGSSVSVIQNMNLSRYLSSVGGITLNEYTNSKEMFKNIDDDSIIVVEKSFYDFYKNTKLKNFSIRYLTSLNLNDKFLLNSDNVVFNKVFNIYLSLLSSKEMNIKAVNNSLAVYHSNPFLQFVTNNVFYLIISLVILMFSFYKLTNKITISKRIKKEDRLLYLDVMTNLKNRNYLNDNIAYWEENIVYPQAIIMLDLNDIKVINDKKGHEAGDNQIKAAANVLIKSQRENSEIIRTDGNEFLIYLVGYEEKIITAYIHKLAKELKNALPYDYGVSFGYSMITDELKSIDDAINETLIIMRKNKEEQKKSEGIKE